MILVLLRRMNNRGVALHDFSSSIKPSNAEATFVQLHEVAKIFVNHQNPVILVFIRYPYQAQAVKAAHKSLAVTAKLFPSY